jgi:YidC/Oxa1 family membrane protein insertase
MQDQNKNLILATVLSFLVILVWFVLFPPPEVTDVPVAPIQTAEAPGTSNPDATTTGAPAPVANAARVAIDTPQLSGSISSLGGRIDDLSLQSYRESLEPGSEIVRLLKPVGEPGAYYTLNGWVTTGSSALADEDLPNPSTPWTIVTDNSLSPDAPVTLRWDNGKGLVFSRTIAVDRDFMFTITDGVENRSAAEVRLAPYSTIARHGVPTDLQNIFVVHEGVIAQTDGIREELGYDDVSALDVIPAEGGPAQKAEATTDGWIGFTDHYWMTMLIPEQGKPFTSVTKHYSASDIYQTEVRLGLMTVAPGAKAETTTRLFAGAKDWEAIRAYQNQGYTDQPGPQAQPIAGFIDSIDWGWFFFLTKPMFAVLHWLNALIGNMGLAIIGLTFVLKLLVLPLAYKSYVSMARMKELQPEMEELKARAGDDRQKMQREMMQLYKDRKVNPAAGCLPILIQIPIFFSLYKVIFVTIELRHAPFFGWLRDLSAPDPSSIFNLFGLLPWAAPEPASFMALIFIGILPILLGITMWLQQKLNPAPADATQAAIFAWMPWVFMFMLGGFASGLVVYWITNNIITFVQQYLIMRSHGHRPDLFGNIKSSVRKKPALEGAANGGAAKPAPAPKPAAKAKPATVAAPKPAAARRAPQRTATAKTGSPKKPSGRK